MSTTSLARSSSSCLGLIDKKSGLEALALKQNLVECGAMIRWCHSAVQVGDVVTKGSDIARVLWETVRPSWFFKHGLGILEDLDEDEFAADVPRDSKNVTLIT